MYAVYDRYIWTHMNSEKEKIFFAGVSWAYQCLLGKKCDRKEGDMYCYRDNKLIKIS